LHDQTLQLLGTALLKAELCEQLAELGRVDEVPPRLAELRGCIEGAVDELRLIMVQLREASPVSEPPAP
jgi:signal transduction histidine kinase